jgi:cytidylate kinase
MKWITFSRKMGTKGSDVAKQVAKELGYRFYDTKAINHMAQTLGFLESVREADERVPSLFQRIFSQKPTVYLERLYSVLYELAKQGNAVFLGRGSHILFRGFEGPLHVRVTASLERRIRTLMGQGLNRDAAARVIARSDEERSAFVKFAFGVDWEDPARYDLVLNMDKLSVPLAVHTVVTLARSPELPEASEEAIRSLERMALASRVDAALMEATIAQGGISSVAVSVVGPGRVRVEGTVESEKRKADAEAVVKSVQGVTAVENAILVVPISLQTV